MDIVFRTVVQLTLTTKIMAFNFEGFMRTVSVPADIKAMILDMHEKQQEFNMPDLDEVTLMEFKTATPFVTSKLNEIMKPTSTVLAKLVTKLNKPVTSSRRLLRTSVTLNPGPSCVDMVTTTPRSPEILLTLPPPMLARPIPLPMVMPTYARVPIMLPMRAYFETVNHDHPPLYKIKQMIEKDEKKWKLENERGDSVSVEIGYSEMSSKQSKDMDTDNSDSRYKDVGSEYYDDFIRVSYGRGRDR